jgi:hypothetical protein
MTEAVEVVQILDYYKMPEKMRVAMLVMQFDLALQEKNLFEVYKNWSDADDAYAQKFFKTLVPHQEH